MSNSVVYFVALDVKKDKLGAFFDYLDNNEIEYDERHVKGCDVSLIVWNEPFLEESTCFWNQIKKFCTEINASEYEETSESFRYKEEGEEK